MESAFATLACDNLRHNMMRFRALSMQTRVIMKRKRTTASRIRNGRNHNCSSNSNGKRGRAGQDGQQAYAVCAATPLVNLPPLQPPLIMKNWSFGGSNGYFRDTPKAFDAKTGVFTAPSDGIYSFRLTTLTFDLPGSTKAAVWNLSLNDTDIDYSAATQGFVVLPTFDARQEISFAIDVQILTGDRVHLEVSNESATAVQVAARMSIVQLSEFTP